MSKHKPKFWVSCLVAGIGLVLFVSSTAAQQTPQTVEQLVIQLDNGKISRFSVDSNGNFTPLISLTKFNLSNLSYSAEAEWEIILPSDIVVSPDGQHLAFTALLREQRKTALFLYTVGQEQFLQIDSPGLGELKWSPDGSAILLVPRQIFTSEQLPNVRDAYLYKLSSSTFTQVTDTPEYQEHDFYWLPSGEYIYVGPGETCTNASPCFDDLYIGNPTDQTQNILVNLSNYLPVDVQLRPTSGCFPHDINWSPSDQRIFYVASCDADPWLNSTLYSVSLQGDNRLELDLGYQYADDNYTEIEELNINPTSGNIYLLVNANRDEEIDRNLRGANRWRILTNRTGQWEELIDERAPNARTMQISPDEQKAAVGGAGPFSGFLMVADLNSGSVSKWENDRAVCHLQWASNDVLEYTEFEDCATGYNTPGRTWRLNLTTNEIEAFNDSLSGVIWAWPIP